MKIIEVVLAALYAIAATGLSSSPTGDAASPVPLGGATIDLDCANKATAKHSVSLPNTTVTVTCSNKFTKVPTDAEGIFLDADCTKTGVLSSVCPGAAVTLVNGAKESGEQKKANVFFPQLPTSAQVVCLKCPDDGNGCKAVIDVAAASPQGPQACAVAGSSVTLQINEAGGSAQFACGAGRTLMPAVADKAYADDCTKEETVKGMTRTPGTYVTLKVDKLKKKKWCFLCQQSAAAAKTGKEDAPCTIYVEVSGSIRLYCSARFGVPLLYVAATLRFI